jgi:hypothetical protein
LFEGPGKQESAILGDIKGAISATNGSGDSPASKSAFGAPGENLPPLSVTPTAIIFPSLARKNNSLVTDPAGAAVPMASVTATNDETGVSSRTQSNNEGGYQIPYLQPGFYTLEVTHPGFKTHHLGPIELRVNDRAKIDVRLEIGLTANRLRFQPTLRT